jgi:hypothetical protein
MERAVGPVRSYEARKLLADRFAWQRTATMSVLDIETVLW